MRTTTALLLALALGVAACGGDDAGGTTTTAAPSTTAGTTTTAGATTADPTAARVAAAAEIAGDYTGEWENTTYGSTGSISANFSVDAATAIATLVFDLGGNVFGAGDPEALTAEFDLSAAGPYAGSNDLFGDFTVDIDESGHLTLEAPAVPGLGGLPLTIEGDFADGNFTGTYVITGLAEGTFSATRA